MGLTCKSCGLSLLKEKFNIKLKNDDELVIALAGNPNVGKSTVFNALTGLKQHTGNWPGKTVTNARGSYKYKDKKFILVDLPGTYSLLANSVEEQVARDFICFGKPNATIIVANATCLERNLNLTLQVMELTNNVILCVNLMDEAKRKGISIDIDKLKEELGIPIVATSAIKGDGLNSLLESIYNVSLGNEQITPRKLKYPSEIEKEIDILVPKIKKIVGNDLDPRWIALRLIEGDNTIVSSINNYIFDNNIEQFNKEVLPTYE